MEGSVKPGQRIRMMASGKEFEVIETGVFLPQMHPVPSLECGSVGYLAASMKNVRDCRVGDTVTLADHPAKEALPGYRKAVPMVYCGLYPVETNDYDNLRDALEKLHLNDAALLFEPERRRPWASASAAASWASYTWTSSANGWNGNTTCP